jgi:hypothetical protein
VFRKSSRFLPLGSKLDGFGRLKLRSAEARIASESSAFWSMALSTAIKVSR